MTNRSTRIGFAGVLFPTTLIASLIGFGVYFDHVASVGSSLSGSVEAQSGPARGVSPSPDVQQMAKWAVDSNDNAGLPFVVVDKARAQLFAFDSQGRLRASAPVLLGASRDDGPVAPATPAGRFVADTGQSAYTDGIVWINDGTSLSLYGLPSSQAPGRGMQRLASGRVEDKRISDGSLHVAGEFYRDYLGPLREQASVAYVLPEVLPVQQVFARPEAQAWNGYAQSPRLAAARKPS